MGRRWRWRTFDLTNSGFGKAEERRGACKRSTSLSPPTRACFILSDHLVPLIIAAFIVGSSKGGLASAAAIAVPALALFMNPVAAAAVLLPVFIATDWVAVWAYRHDFSPRNLKILIPGILLGTTSAAFITPYTPQSALLVFTGAVGLWYCWRSWFTKSGREKQEARVLPGLFWGWLTGIASFITHSGAPPTQAFLLPQQMKRLTLSGTIAIAFAASNLSKLPGYYALGQLDGFDWKLTTILIAAGGAGTLLGRMLVKRLDEERFLHIIEGLLFVLSLLLVGKGAVMALGQG